MNVWDGLCPGVVGVVGVDVRVVGGVVVRLID